MIVLVRWTISRRSMTGCTCSDHARSPDNFPSAHDAGVFDDLLMRDDDRRFTHDAGCGVCAPTVAGRIPVIVARGSRIDSASASTSRAA